MDERTVSENQSYQRDGHGALAKTLIWVGVAGVSAAIALTVIRALVMRTPADPTSERIQHLIDEANQLLKTLDDQRSPK